MEGRGLTDNTWRALGCQNCALHSGLCEKAFSSEPGSSTYSNRKLLQLLVWLGNANILWVKPHSTAGRQDSWASHEPSVHGEVAQCLSAAQGRDRQTPPVPVPSTAPAPAEHMGFYLLHKTLQATSELSSQLTGSKDDKPGHRDAAQNPVCQQRYRLMENLFPGFIKQGWKQERASKQTRIMKFVPLGTKLTWKNSIFNNHSTHLLEMYGGFEHEDMGGGSHYDYKNISFLFKSGTVFRLDGLSSEKFLWI